jgi:hypothetical protein
LLGTWVPYTLKRAAEIVVRRAIQDMESFLTLQ